MRCWAAGPEQRIVGAMDQASQFLAAVEAVQTGTSTVDQAKDVLAMARLCGRADLVDLSQMILKQCPDCTERERDQLARPVPVPQR
jgi:hypothetical protein